jgi:hypothetical protein
VTLAPNQTLHPKITAKGRAAMAKAGKKNLDTWLKKPHNPPPDVAADAGRFRADLEAELTAPITGGQRALLLCAESAYLAISLALLKLRRTRRLRRLEAAFDRLARLQGSLLRVLRELGMRREVPDGQTLDEVLDEYAAKKESDAQSPTTQS